MKKGAERVDRDALRREKERSAREKEAIREMTGEFFGERAEKAQKEEKRRPQE